MGTGARGPCGGVTGAGSFVVSAIAACVLSERRRQVGATMKACAASCSIKYHDDGEKLPLRANVSKGVSASGSGTPATPCGEGLTCTWEHLRLESGQAVLKTSMYATNAYLAPLAFEITLQHCKANNSVRSGPYHDMWEHSSCTLGNAASDNICEIAVACVCVCVACINACVYDVRVFQTMADAESTSCLCTS